MSDRRPFLLLALVSCSAAAAAAQSTWRSALFPADWKPGHRDTQGRFLHDFSYAGYRRGEWPLPSRAPGPRVDVTAPPYSADSTGRADVTAVLQRALDDVGGRGGGTVFLPPGTYRVSFAPGARFALRVADPRVVLAGAGARRSRLFLDATLSRGRSVIAVEPRSSGRWARPVGRLELLAVDTGGQATEVAVPDPRAFSAGEWIVLRNNVTDAFIAEHGMRGYWTIAIEGVAFYRQIRAVSIARSTIILDAPLRYPLKVRDAARIHRVVAPITDAGVEYLSIGMRENSTPGMGVDDWQRPGTGAWKVHNSAAIRATHARDCWIRGVGTHRPPGNRGSSHLHSNGVVLWQCQHCTVRDCYVGFPQYRGAGGNGYGYIVRGGDCLFERDVAERCRHAFSVSEMYATGNVLLRCSSRDALLPTDFHKWLSPANLMDSMVMDGDHLEAKLRDCCGHGHATTQSVFWNTRGDAYLPGRPYIVDSRQLGHGYVIGTRGPASAVKTAPLVIAGRSTAPADWVEGVGRGHLLEPASLYEAQLALRLGYVAFGAGCPSSAGSPALGPWIKGQRPRLNTGFTAAVRNLPGPTGAVVGVLGFSRDAWGSLRLPLDLGFAGMPGCALLVRPDLDVPLVRFGTSALWTLPIPDRAALLGQAFYQQAIAVAPGANRLGLVVSNGGAGRIGAR